MGTLKASDVSSDRQKWQKIFNALVQMLWTYRTQIESFLEEKKLLEDRIKLQYDQISQMKRDFTVQKMVHTVEAAKSDLVMGLKQREAFFYKLKFDDAGIELADFKELFHYLSHKLSETNDISKIEDIKDEGRHCKVLESEVRRLKSEAEQLISKNNSEVSALLAEKKFVWNQYNKMEKEKVDQLRIKCAEIEQANEKIQKLLSSMEQLHLSNSEKDSEIITLKTTVTKLEADSIKKSEEISRLSRELETLRKSRSASVTPVLRRCSAETGNSRSGVKNGGTDRQNVIVKKEPYRSQIPEHLKDSKKGCQGSKRKTVEKVPFSDAPKLFTSAFKVPKLKNSTPPHVTRSISHHSLRPLI